MSSFCANMLAGVLLVSVGLPAQAQPTPRRTALLIGNSEYSGRTLKTAAADADLMRDMLGVFRFNAELVRNAGFARMQEALGAFAGRLGSRDSGLLYYAGFCAQTSTDTFLIPVDFEGRTEADLKERAVSVRELQARFELKGSGLKVLAFSGCRDYNDASWRRVAPAPSDGNVAVILAMEPALASPQDGTSGNGVFMMGMREALGGRDTDLLGALLSAASGFGTSIGNPERAQVAWKLSGPANDFRLRMEPRAAAAKPPARSTVRDFLVRGRTEAAGYGLYSYLLFPSRPAPVDEARYREIIEVYRSMLQEAGNSSFAPRDLNITYIPVTGSLAPSATAQQILAAYDYDSALNIMQVQRRGSGVLKGPYVISSLVPLSGATVQAELFIIQDLSSVPQNLIPLYIREFEAKASEQRSWTAERMDGFLLTVRTAISAVANEGVAAQPAFAVVIDLFKKSQ
jgi:hypothetical protein